MYVRMHHMHHECVVTVVIFAQFCLCQIPNMGESTCPYCNGLGWKSEDEPSSSDDEAQKDNLQLALGLHIGQDASSKFSRMRAKHKKTKLKYKQALKAAHSWQDKCQGLAAMHSKLGDFMSKGPVQDKKIQKMRQQFHHQFSNLSRSSTSSANQVKVGENPAPSMQPEHQPQGVAKGKPQQPVHPPPGVAKGKPQLPVFPPPGAAFLKRANADEKHPMSIPSGKRRQCKQAKLPKAKWLE